MLNPWMLVALAWSCCACLGCCDSGEDVVNAHLVIPNGYRGVVKLKFEQEGGLSFPQGSDPYVIPVDDTGVAKLAVPDFTLGWHRVTAQYQDGVPIPYVSQSDPPPKPEEVALYNLLGQSDEGSDAWFYAGTKEEYFDYVEQLRGIRVK